MSVTQTLSVTEVEGSLNTSANTSKVRILWKSTQAGESWNGYTRTAKYYVSINGGAETEYAVTYTLPQSTTKTIVDTTITVTHKSDGSGSVKVRTWMDTGISIGVVEKSQSIDLTTIPRASTLNSLSCATRYFNGTLTYKYTPKSSSFYNRCNISLNINGTYTAIKSVMLGKQSASQKTATVTFSEDELSIIYNELTNTNKGTLRFTLRTYSDSSYSTQIGEAVQKEISLYIPEDSSTKPTATMTLSPITSLGSPFNTLYIKGRTKVDANFTNGEGKYGASIVSYVMRVGGKDYNAPYTSAYLTTTGEVTVTGTLTDSRGFSNTYTEKITVIPYGDPKILPASNEKSIICARCDAEGNLSDSGTYLKIKARRSYYKVESNGVQKNFCAIRYRYRAESTTSFTSWKTILASDDTSTDTITTEPISDVVSSTQKAYVVQVGVIDDIGESDAVQFMIPTDFVVADIPDEYKGRSVGIFRYAVAPEGDEKRIDIDGFIHGGGVDNLTLGEILNATSIAPLDLNDYKVPGNYYSPSADNSKYIINSPYADGGFSLTVRELQSKTMIRQELFYGRTNWQRHYIESTDTWSGWLRYLMTDHDSSTAVDFVTETGVWNIDDNDTNKGYWRYRKWKSGAVDMNGLIKVTPITEGTLGTAGVFYSEVINIDLPFEVVNFQFTGSSTSYHCFVGNCNSVDGNNKQIRLRLYRFTDFASLADYDVYVRIVASGKIK